MDVISLIKNTDMLNTFMFARGCIFLIFKAMYGPAFVKDVMNSPGKNTSPFILDVTFCAMWCGCSTAIQGSIAHHDAAAANSVGIGRIASLRHHIYLAKVVAMYSFSQTSDICNEWQITYNMGGGIVFE